MAKLRDRCVRCGLDLPAVLLAAPEFDRLRSLTNYQHSSVPSHVTRMLSDALDRAEICAPERVPSDVVTMNSRFSFCTTEMPGVQTRTLVSPHLDQGAPDRLSVLSPVGAAVLGIREGSSVLYLDGNGVAQEVRLEKVVAQPKGCPTEDAVGREQIMPKGAAAPKHEDDRAPKGSEPRVLPFRPPGGSKHGLKLPEDDPVPPAA